MKSRELASPKQRFEHLVKVISSERFIKRQGLGNEVPFFICPYAAEEAASMEQQRGQLINQLTNRSVAVLEVSLYDLAIDLLKQRGIWEQVLELEQSTSKAELKELLQGVLDPAAHLVPEIGRRIEFQDHAVLFLSGVGEVFPYIRSHSVLNNLQSTAKDKPTVIFFPGSYTHTPAIGASLDLFGMLHDDK